MNWGAGVVRSESAGSRALLRHPTARTDGRRPDDRGRATPGWRTDRSNPGSGFDVLRFRPTVLWTAALAVYAVVLLLYVPGESMWGDEAFVAEMMELSWTQLLADIVGVDTNVAIYYLLLRGVAEVFGTGDVALRAFSVACATASVALTARLGRQLFGAQAGIIAAVLLAANPFFVRIAMTARAYALFVLICILTWLVVLAALERRDERGSWRWWLLWGVISGAAFYVHMLTVFVVIAQLCYVLARNRAIDRYLLVAMALITAAGIPTLLLVDPFKTVLVIPSFTFTGAATVLIAVLGGPVAVLLVPLAGAGIYALVRSSGPGWWNEPRSVCVWWLSAAVILPLVLVPIQSLFVSYYFSPILVPIALLAGYAADRLGGRRCAAVVLASSMVGACFVLYRGVQSDLVYAGQEWRSAERLLAARVGPGDVVAFSDPFWRIPIERYGRFHGGSGSATWTDARPALPDRAWYTVRPIELDRMSRQDVFQSSQRVQEQLGEARSVWMVGGDDARSLRLQAALTESGFGVAEATQLDGILVVHFLRAGSE